MGSYRKQVKGDNNSASEQFAHNHIILDFHGIGPGILAGFVVVALCVAIGWMMLRNGGLLAFLVTSAIIAFFAGGGAVGAMFVVRYWSGTRRQLNSDKAAEAWEKLLHYTDSHIVLLDPKTQTFHIENARDIQEVRHFNDRPQIIDAGESLNTSNDLPPMSDLLR